MFEGVLERISRSRPAIVEVRAPAGYGKSTLLGRLSTLGPSQIFNCRRAEHVRELRKRALAAAAAHQACFLCFDHLDELDDAAWETVHALVRERNPGVTYVLSSRRGLRFRLSEVAAPHEISRVTLEDLRLTAADVEALFQGSADARTVKQILRRSAGWPVAALLLLRLSNERTPSAALQSWDAPAFSDLHSYLRGEIVDQLPAAARHALEAAAAVPNARAYEIEELAGADAALAMADAAQSTGLAWFEDSALRVHPMLAHALPPRARAETERILQSAGDGNARRGEYLRAAALYADAGNFPAAAETLEAYVKSGKPLGSCDFGSLLVRIPLEAVMTHPRIWALRIACLGNVPSDTELEQRLRAEQGASDPAGEYARNLQIALGVLNVRFGALSAGERLLRDARSNCASCNDWGIGCAVIRANRAVVAARRGRLDEAERHWTRVRLCSAPSGERRMRHDRFEIDLHAAYALGNWSKRASELLETLRVISRTACEPTFFAALRTFTWFAWLADDAASMEESLQIGAVAQCGEADIGAGMAAGGRDARSRAIAAILRAAAAPSVQECLTQVERAMHIAETLEEPLLAVIACVVLRLADERRGREALKAMAAQDWFTLTPELAGEVRALAQDTFDTADLPVLGTFIARCARSEWYREQHGLVVELLSGRVRRGQRVVNVSDRGMDLLACLALHQRPVGRHELIDALWADLDDVAAFNALKTCVHRTRQQLDDPDSIVSERRSYALSAEIRVDAVTMESFCRSLEGRASLSAAEIDRLEGYARTLEQALTGVLLRSEWFAPFEARFTALHHRIVSLLAEEAGRHADTPRIVRLAEGLLHVDPCDEAAYELIITSLLAAGNRMEAYREYQRYRRAVAGEENLVPSETLTRLLVEG